MRWLVEVALSVAVGWGKAVGPVAWGGLGAKRDGLAAGEPLQFLLCPKLTCGNGRFRPSKRRVLPTEISPLLLL